MYVPPAFREDRPEVLASAIRAHPLATLVTAEADGLRANLIPFILSEGPEGLVLRAHMAKANDQLPGLRTGTEALVIFQGPEAYITPTWYASKREHGKVVPTWNYVVVQVWGTPRVVNDTNWLLDQINALTARQEDGRPVPWSTADAPESYIAAQLKGILGLEIPIRRIEGKWKVSQNQPQANREGVISGLRTDGLHAMAETVDRSQPG